MLGMVNEKRTNDLFEKMQQYQGLLAEQSAKENASDLEISELFESDFLWEFKWIL
jgi:hypothetical protein